MTSIFDREPGRRWPRGQKFRLSPRGIEAEAACRVALSASRALGGRAAFDATLATWAAQCGLRPEDGSYLSELRAAPRSVAELVEALDACGATKSDVKVTIDRLVEANIAEPVTEDP